MTPLRAIQAFAFDLDGTIWAGPHLLPGALEFVAAVREAGLGAVFASNSSQRGADELAEKLSRLGIPAEHRDVVSAFDLAAVEILNQIGPAPILALGTDELAAALREAGHEPLSLDRWAEARAVVVAVDPHFNYDKLRAASRAVAAGASFFAVNLDSRFPVADGQFDPGCGALVEAIAVASGGQPIDLGKPSPEFFQAVLDRLKLPADQIAMIGDNHASDIKGGHAAGMFTIWIGEDKNPGLDPAPDLVVADLAELGRLWSDARR